MTRFVITGKLSDPSVANRLNEKLISAGDVRSTLATLNLELDHVDVDGDDKVYYLKEAKGPNILCD